MERRLENLASISFEKHIEVNHLSVEEIVELIAEKSGIEVLPEE